jgi:hypothetical protein
MEVNLHFVLYEDLFDKDLCQELPGASVPPVAQGAALRPLPPNRHEPSAPPDATQLVAHITIIRGTNPADVDFDLTDPE